jgi:hypothetical protein
VRFSALVGAFLVIQAFVGYAEALDGMAGDKVLRDNGFGVLGLDIPVPHGFRVDHDHGSVLALVQASGLVDAHPASQPCGL